MKNVVHVSYLGEIKVVLEDLDNLSQQNFKFVEYSTCGKFIDKIKLEIFFNS